MRRRDLAIVAVVLVAQTIALVAYFRRDAPPLAAPRAITLGGEPAPPLATARGDGVARVAPSGPRLVHFWATWCAPCRTELPRLLALAPALRARGITLEAVATDAAWETLEAYFPGGVPSEVARVLDAAAPARYGVLALPDSYVVDAAGRLVARFAGAQRWDAPAAVEVIERAGTPMGP